MTESERIAALENRVRILEALIASLLDSGEDDDDAPPAEDLDGNAIPRAESGW
jgi:hypothetical protein